MGIRVTREEARQAALEDMKNAKQQSETVDREVDAVYALRRVSPAQDQHWTSSMPDNSFGC